MAASHGLEGSLTLESLRKLWKDELLKDVRNEVKVAVIQLKEEMNLFRKKIDEIEASQKFLASQYDKVLSNLQGVLAMTCINELLSKNCVPQEYEEYLLKLFQQTFQLLQRITKDSASSSDDHLSELDESYLNKFTEFLHLFVSIHLRGFENSSHFPILELLTLLYKYTFHQVSHNALALYCSSWEFFDLEREHNVSLDKIGMLAGDSLADDLEEPSVLDQVEESEVHLPTLHAFGSSAVMILG
ncbi:predicted protein [Nematostella vectensis]|uniref:Uncharacterized protein n=1 Tax=Nematostella vectensis TaxID=45351 RepID=A7T5F5_NEMVE|nr:predicted protein [Nematostella vectensis]|eukprot:XP_001620908.1 hypothetical protein NEMVEDRAFT_v1g248742 [Nematostella vectensis]